MALSGRTPLPASLDRNPRAVMHPPTVGIVVVNYRTPALVAEGLAALAAERATYPHFTVVVVENASPDDSLAVLRDVIDRHGWGGWVTLIAAPANRGYGAGNNIGLVHYRGCPPDYLLLLNPDTVVRPGAIAALVRFLEAHPRAGLVGSRLEHPDGRPQQSAFRFPTFLSELDGGARLGLLTRVLHRHTIAPPVRDEPHVTDWVCGASVMLRWQVVEQVGDFDEKFFLYFEEVDYIRRARDLGYECWYEPASRVVHLEGQSTGATGEQARLKRVPGYWFASRTHYFRKHHGRATTLATDVVWLGGYLSWRVRRVLQRKPDRDPPHLAWDFFRHNFLPAGPRGPA